jgi:hypothetical protein
MLSGTAKLKVDHGYVETGQFPDGKVRPKVDGVTHISLAKAEVMDVSETRTTNDTTKTKPFLFFIVPSEC